MRSACLTLLLLSLAAPAAAQTSPYAGEAPRAIKALSDEEVRSLADGAGMGFARAAELNGLPGPRHTLDLAADLHLDEVQRTALEAIFRRMQTEARRLGAEIVERERALDSLFASGTTDADRVRARAEELGLLYGRLRAAHLVAHLETTRLLNRHQIARYAELRGYRDDDPGGGPAHDSHH